MDYTISCFTWSFWDYTQKSTTPILALKLSVSAIITPGGLPHYILSLKPREDPVILKVILTNELQQLQWTRKLSNEAVEKCVKKVQSLQLHRNEERSRKKGKFTWDTSVLH